MHLLNLLYRCLILDLHNNNQINDETQYNTLNMIQIAKIKSFMPYWIKTSYFIWLGLFNLILKYIPDFLLSKIAFRIFIEFLEYNWCENMIFKFYMNFTTFNLSNMIGLKVLLKHGFPDTNHFTQRTLHCYICYIIHCIKRDVLEWKVTTSLKYILSSYVWEWGSEVKAQDFFCTCLTKRNLTRGFC